MKAKTAFQTGDKVRVRKTQRLGSVLDVLPSGRVLCIHREHGAQVERLHWPKALEMVKRRPQQDVQGITVARGFGYVGRWRGGALGWQVPPFLTGYANMPDSNNVYVWGAKGHRRDAKLVLCEITVRQVFDKKGRARTMNRHPAHKNESAAP